MMLLLYQASARSSVLMHATVIRKPLVFWHRSFELKNELFQVIIVCAMIQHFQNNADHIDAAKKMSNFFRAGCKTTALEKKRFDNSPPLSRAQYRQKLVNKFRLSSCWPFYEFFSYHFDHSFSNLSPC